MNGPCFVTNVPPTHVTQVLPTVFSCLQNWPFIIYNIKFQLCIQDYIDGSAGITMSIGGIFFYESNQINCSIEFYLDFPLTSFPTG